MTGACWLTCSSFFSSVSVRLSFVLSSRICFFLEKKCCIFLFVCFFRSSTREFRRLKDYLLNWYFLTGWLAFFFSFFLDLLFVPIYIESIGTSGRHTVSPFGSKFRFVRVFFVFVLLKNIFPVVVGGGGCS